MSSAFCVTAWASFVGINIIIIIIIMHGISTYIPEPNHVSREHSVAAILQFLFMVHITLFVMLNLLHFYTSTFRSVCAVHNIAVLCRSLISCFPVMFLMYYVSDCEMVRVAPLITGITFVFTFHMRCVSVLRSLYFRIYSASFFITCLSLEILTFGIVTATTVLRRTCSFDTDHLRQACARSDYPSELIKCTIF